MLLSWSSTCTGAQVQLSKYKKMTRKRKEKLMETGHMQQEQIDGNQSTKWRLT
jgi:hypothetical protein